ncbi:MAG TPA: hypothetical protein VJO35_18370 [Terriglobales bacterium]|nr:hypothetical protein [Terriglobales bacterium]
MNFLRYKSSTGCLAAVPQAPPAWPLLSFGSTGVLTRRNRNTSLAALLTLLFISTCVAQSSRDLTGTEISQYLITRKDKVPKLKAQTSSALSVDAIVEKMTAANARRAAELRGFQGKRWYRLQYHGFLGGRDASMEVLATYSAPDKREFTVISETGSHVLLSRVLLKLLDSERQAFENRKQFELGPANYKFEFVDTEHASTGNTYYVLSVKPRKNNEFLYNGKIWVDADDFAVVRMEGEPAKSPSFWIRDTQIKSNWEKIGDFWFIAHNSSVSHIRMGGTATLNIDYGDYQVTGVDHRAAMKNQAQGPDLPDPAAITPQR